jgi:hypothetical protein
MWPNSSTVVSQILLAGLIFCILYLTGQVVTNIGNFFLDRIFVFKCYGYPFEYLLLGDPKKDIPDERFSRHFYRGSVFWLHVTALCWGVYVSLPTILWLHWSMEFVARFSFNFFALAIGLRLIEQGLKKWFPGHKYIKKSQKSLKGG